jgi:hypothetical protein
MNNPHATGSPAALLGRLIWMMIGPLALILLTMAIVREGGGWLTPYDIAYFAVLGAMFLGRGLEFRGGHPQTADGEPATAQHLRRYLLFGALLGLAVWALANVLGNHVLT